MSNWIDNLVAYFSPAAGIRRMQERLALNYYNTHSDQIRRSYEAAKIDRLTKGWRPSNQSADLELDSDADIIRARVHDLVRNNAYAQGVLRAGVRNVVGTGIRPQAQVHTPSGELNEVFNESTESFWHRWQLKADVTGRLSFYEILALAYCEWKEAGECLLQFVESNDRSRPLPLAIEMIDIDRLASDERYPKQHAANGNEVRRGVEIDAVGRPVAYWLYPHHPNDLNVSRMTPERHPADNFIHLYRPQRIGQTRGVSSFASIVRWIKNLDRYMDNELTSSTIASCFSVAIKTLRASADGGLGGPSSDDGQDENSNPFEYLEPGIVARLFPEEEVQVIDPSRRQSDAVAWLTLMQRALGVGAGLSYERLTRDYSQTNYSSNRASDLEDRKEFRMDQEFLITHLCIPTWHRFMGHAVRAEIDEFPSFIEYIADIERWNHHEWQAPGWEWVDPQKEVTAIVSAIDNNLATLAEEKRKRDGGDWRATVKQRGVEKQLIAQEQGEPQEEPDEEDEEEATQDEGIRETVAS